MRSPFLFLLATISLLPSPAIAGSGGPDGFGYTWKDSAEPGGPVYQFIEPTVFAQTILANNSAAAGTITLVQPWGGIYGTPVSQLRVSRNGFLSDDPGDPGTDETNDAPLPAPPSVGGGNRIYVLHDNLELDTSTGRVSYEYFAESPHPLHDCGVHVITWRNMHHGPSDPDLFDFQVLLFDNLEILMQFPAGNPEQGSGSTTGLQNSAASQGLTVFGNIAGSLSADLTVRISPPQLTVTTAVDELDTPAGAALSLREAVRDAPSGWRIGFAPAMSEKVINLSVPGGGQGGRIDLSGKVLAIDAGDLAEPVAVSGGGLVRHFAALGGAWLSLGKLRLEQGAAVGMAGSTSVEGASTLVTSGCSWLDNFATGDGGAVLVTGASTARFNTTDFFGNGTNSSGGAVSGKLNSTLHAEMCRFWRNRGGDDGSGNGGAFALNAAVANLRHCDLALNSTANFGGAVVGNINSTLNATGCTFDSNRALNGGAIAAENAFGAGGIPMVGVLQRCTFYRNFGLLAGGAVYENTTTSGGLKANLSFRYCTIVENHAGVGGAGFRLQDSEVEIAASILAYNRLATVEDNLAVSGSGTLDSSPGDNLESGNEAGFSLNNGISNAAPKLTGLGYYGGFVRTCLLLAGSPGIDGVQLESYPPGFDARGFFPLRNGTGVPGADNADIGATERGESHPVTTAAAAGPGSLQAAIDAAHDGGTIVFSGVRRIELADEVTVPPGKSVFIEASAAGGVELLGLGMELDQGQTVSLHQVTLTGAGNRSLATGNFNQSRSSFTLSDCRVRQHVALSTATSVVSLWGPGRASVLASDLRGRFAATTNTEVLRARGSAATLIVRDTRLSELSSASENFSAIQASGGVLLVQGSSVTGSEFRTGGVSNGAIVLAAGGFTSRVRGLVENTTISGNRLLGTGGPGSKVAAIAGTAANVAGGVIARLELEVTHSTLVDNLGDSAAAAGVSVEHFAPGQARVQLANTIVAGNAPAAFGGNANFQTRGGNLSDASPAFFGVNDFPGTSPRLYPPSVGPTGAPPRAPRPGCPCIDAGQVRSIGARDGRGGVRFLDGDGSGVREPDIGAVESGRVLVVTTADDENDGDLGLGAGDSLRECVAAAAANDNAVNLDVSAIASLSLASQLLVAGRQVDIDGLDQGLDLATSLPGAEAFRVEGEALFAAHGLHFQATGGALTTFGGSAATLGHGSIRGATVPVADLREQSRVRFAGLDIHENTSPARILWLRGFSRLDLAESCFRDHGGSGIAGVQIQNDAALDATGVTFTRNAAASGTLLLQNRSKAYLDRCTIARNGAGIGSSNESLLGLSNCILSNNVDLPIFGDGLPRSYGGNVSNRGSAAFDPALGDFPHRDPFLGPLADDDGDGVPTLRPLARGPAFGTRAGAAPPPPQVITVNTADDQDNVPAGAFISLREAIRDIAPGGTVLFAPELNNAALKLVNTAGEIEVTKSVTIDATALHKGIDLIGRLHSSTPGVALGLHGVHLRDHLIAGGSGALVSMTGGALVTSHSTFSGGAITTGGVGGAISLDDCLLAMENATVTGNSAGQAGALRLLGGSAEIRHSTLARNVNVANAGGGVEVGGGAQLRLYGNAFFGNTRNNGASAAPQISVLSGTVVSLGYNATSSASLPGAVASDVVSISNASYQIFADRGGLVDTLKATVAAASVKDTLPPVVSGEVPPPLTDARGFSRVSGSAADWGANEFGGRAVDSDGDGLPDWWEDLYGFDSDSPDDTTADADGDGATLLEEFHFLTDPFAGASFLDFTFLYNTLLPTPTVVLTWNSSHGMLYDVEASETLAAWDVVNTQFGNGGLRLFQDPIGPGDPPRNFYRLRLRD